MNVDALLAEGQDLIEREQYEEGEPFLPDYSLIISYLFPDCSLGRRSRLL
jgi:hypothetical protein